LSEKKAFVLYEPDTSQYMFYSWKKCKSYRNKSLCGTNTFCAAWYLT